GLIVGGYLWYLDAPLREASTLLQSNQPEQALETLDAWKSPRAESSAAQALRARCLVRTGRASAAFRIFSEVGAATTDELHDWATACLHLQRWAEALPLLLSIHEDRPDDVDVIHELAACNARLGELNTALAYAQEYTEKSDFRQRGLLLSGMILRQLDRKSEAAEHWEQLLQAGAELKELQVTPAEFLLQYGTLKLELGNPQRAAELFRSSLDDKETAEGRYQLGKAEEQLGHMDLAEANWRRTIELETDHAAARESLARIELSRSNTDAARSLLQPILEQPDLTSSAAYLMERVFAIEGNAEQAAVWKKRTESLRKHELIRSTMNQLLQDDGESYWAQVVRCFQFAEAGNWRQAEISLESLPRAADEDPFVMQLRKAIPSRQRQSLPSIDGFPVQLL
ncbi:MAG: tetratricopeptide repeat protein, partial [Planctomycetaceae bacterium]|nr:tetratricopeptide repeat protein [Planctomycetaceae bacterium]